MPSVKISELPILNQLSANNANTVFVAVDKTTNTTSQFSTTTLAAGLFANNVLNVGTQNPSSFPGLIAQFIANNATYGQVNFENVNANGSMDVVLTADIGDDANNYIDLGINNSVYTDPQYSSMKALDGYLMVAGEQGNDYVGNLVIGTTAAETNVVFSIGGTTNLDVVAKMTKNGLEFDNGAYLTFDDGSTQTTAALNPSVALSAQANTIVTQGVDATQNTNITSVNQFAQSAYNKANNALANTDGVFTAGSFNVSGNLTANGTLVLANSNFSATEAAVTISATAGVATPSNDGYMLHISGKQNVASRIVADSYGANTYVVFAGRSSRGTRLAPQAIANNDVMMRISGNGYGTTGYAPLGVGRIDIVATENHTDSNRGTRIEMWNMPIGSNTLNRIATFNGESVEFTGVVNPQKGFVYTANTYPSSQTAINISFSDGPVYRAQTSAGLVVTLSNFYAGKSVEFWLTNTAGTGQTFTHGCSAINSTVNSTTYNIPATSSIYAKYYCLDGTLANTFVAITHP